LTALVSICRKHQKSFLVLDRSEKASIISSLIKKTNALEMKWLLMIILKGEIILFIAVLCTSVYFAPHLCSLCISSGIWCKDLKLGISEKSIFQEFHPDAEDLFNVTCDLKFVCEKLNDRSQRHKRQVMH
jgi:DNA ligase 4